MLTAFTAKTWQKRHWVSKQSSVVRHVALGLQKLASKAAKVLSLFACAMFSGPLVLCAGCLLFSNDTVLPPLEKYIAESRTIKTSWNHTYNKWVQSLLDEYNSYISAFKIVCKIATLIWKEYENTRFYFKLPKCIITLFWTNFLNKRHRNCCFYENLNKIIYWRKLFL